MANYTDLLATIDSIIKTNGANAITGADHQGVLHSVVTAIGGGYNFIGVAVPSTNPGTPDEKQFYVAKEAGTYSHFGNAIVNIGEIAFLKGSGSSWTKEIISIYEDYDKYADVDPTTIGTPESGKFFEGVFGGKPWIKDDAGNITYVYDELFALGY